MKAEAGINNLCVNCQIGEYQSCPFAAKVEEYNLEELFGLMTHEQRDALVQDMREQAEKWACTRLDKII